jgi:hypothetical protein
VTGDHAAQRPGDDDYDLLTYGEAAARLTEEIRKERRRLGELEERARRGTDAGQGEADAGAAGPGHASADIAAVRRRIADLPRAAERQARQQREARDFARFFGYDPRAR